MPDTSPTPQDDSLVELIPGFIYDCHLTLLSGAPNAGKSVFMQWVAHQLVLGLLGFWGSLPPMRVLILSERSRAGVATQMRNCSLQWPLSEDNFRIFTITDLDPYQQQQFCMDPYAYIMRWLGNFKPQLIVLDTLFKFLPADPKGKTTNDYESTGRRIQYFECWVHTRMKCAAVGIHHTAKQYEGRSYSNPLERSLGSQAIVGGTLCTWIMDDCSIGERKIVKVIPHSHIVHLWKPLFFEYNASGVHQVQEPAQDLFDNLTIGPFQRTILSLVMSEMRYDDLIEKVMEALPNTKRFNIDRAVTKLISLNLILMHKSSDGSVWLQPIKPS